MFQSIVCTGEERNGSCVPLNWLPLLINNIICDVDVEITSKQTCYKKTASKHVFSPFGTHHYIIMELVLTYT